MSEENNNLILSIFPGVEDRQWFLNHETGEYWFHATGICSQLGFANVSRAVQLHTDEDERFQEIVDGRTVWFVSEAGCFSLALASKTDKAKKFKRWLTHDVLPKLRKSGAYVSEHITPDQSFQLLTNLLTKEFDRTVNCLQALESTTANSLARDEVERRILTQLSLKEAKLPSNLEEERTSLANYIHGVETFNIQKLRKAVEWCQSMQQQALAVQQGILSEVDYQLRCQAQDSHNNRVASLIKAWSDKFEATLDSKGRLTYPALSGAA